MLRTNEDMNNVDLMQAIELLRSGQYTCVLIHSQLCLTTCLRGVRPLVQWLRSGTVPAGFSAADKVVGKATAFLYCLLGAKAVYANVMSRGAKEVLERSGIYAQCAELTDHIENRTKDGICPFEAAVQDIENADQALDAIYRKMNALGISCD